MSIYDSQLMQPTICFVTTGDISINATAKRALGMAAPLVQRGWAVTILLEDTTENRHRAEIECAGAANVIVFTQHSARDEIRNKNRIIAHRHIDVLYLSAPVARNIVRTPKRCRLVVEHSELMSHFSGLHALARFKAMFFELLSVVQADALVCASHYLYDIFSQRALHMRCHPSMLYLPYAYNERVCHPMPVNRATICGGRYAGRKVFCYMGSITHSYGALTMTAAIDQLRRSHPEALLIMMGHGPAYDEVRQAIAQRQLTHHIEQTGYVNEEDIDRYFSLADYFILPMRDTEQDWARCPSKLYMYLPYDRPIVTCRIGEPWSVLGDKGTYYQAGNAEDMATQMAQLIDSGNTHLGIAPKEHTWQARAEVFDQWIRGQAKTDK